MFLAGKFVNHTGLSPILIYFSNQQNCKRGEAEVSGLEGKCAFQLIKISL